jgi:hypothetical protein
MTAVVFVCSEFQLTTSIWAGSDCACTVRNSSTISVEVDPSIEYSLRPRPSV